MPPRFDYNLKRRPPRWAYLKAFIPSIITFLILSFGLTAYSYLHHPSTPAASDSLGWQAWDIINRHAETDNPSHVNNGSAEASIPLDIWDPMARHTTPLTELYVKWCIMSPMLFPLFCRPPTTAEDDKLKGSWVLVERNLNLQTGFWQVHLNIWYRRTRRLDVPAITNLQVLPNPPPDNLDLDGWTRAHGELHAGVRSLEDLRLWYKTRSQSAIASSKDEIITEISLHYGDDEPFFGFHRVNGGMVTPGDAKGKYQSVDIVWRRGNPVPPKAPLPTFHENGTFKIMQIADLHYSVGTGKCYDTNKKPCVGDEDTATWLAEALDIERPDLVVFSGDQLNGQRTSYDADSVLAKFAQPVIAREIGWAAVFGNHDSEIEQDRREQMWAMQHMPYSLARAGPADVDGVGNYDIRVYSPDASRTHIFTLYFLDSGDYQKRLLPWARPDYDYLKPSQIDWFLDASSRVDMIERPFTPDGGTDLGNVWTRGGSGGAGKRRSTAQPQAEPRQDPFLAKPNAMMFFHIPLQEAYADADPAPSLDDPLYADGTLNLGIQLDWEGSSKTQSNFFSDAVQEALESPASRDSGMGAGGKAVTEVKVLAHGHCHNTDRCRRVQGVWMCFDGGSSYAGYGDESVDRRVRVYEVSQWGEKIATYKRLTTGETLDHQVLVGDGAPAGWGQAN